MFKRQTVLLTTASAGKSRNILEIEVEFFWQVFLPACIHTFILLLTLLVFIEIGILRLVHLLEYYTQKVPQSYLLQMHIQMHA